jgi:nucleoside 2-deoxyribosyltransferase
MNRPFCFFIMPFRPELNFFYLYLKRHLDIAHNIDCERGDERILTKSVLEKISDYIRKSDVIIADCSGKNPNVFYELGLAHAADKKVILLSQDEAADAPVDIRHFEFIKYNLKDDEKVLIDIDNAIRNVLSTRYETLYVDARTIFRQFRDESKIAVKEASKEIFVLRISNYEKTRDLPLASDEYTLKEVVLPRIIEDPSDIQIMSAITNWLSRVSLVKPTDD